MTDSREGPAPWAPLEPEPPAGPAIPPPDVAAQPAFPSTSTSAIGTAGTTGGDDRTGPLPLRPLVLNDILDGAFKLFKANFRTLVIVAAVFLLPVDVLAAYLGRHASVGLGLFTGRTNAANSGVIDLPAAYWLLTTVDYFFVRPLVAGAVSFVVAESYLGRQTEPGQALKVAGRCSVALVVASFVTHLLASLG